MNDLLKEIADFFNSNPKGFIAFAIFIFGIILFGFGKKAPVLRLFLGDKSVFFQLFWGAIISLIGIALIYLFR
ncbi:hypothetical protein [Holzapfeliella sp. JNUCC 80]